MKRRALWIRGILVVAIALVTMQQFPASARAFAPRHHMDTIMGPLEAVGFSESEAWLITFFALEVDLYQLYWPFCWVPIRWHTQLYACPEEHDPHLQTDPCLAGGRFSDWVEWCLPFHNCRTPYPIGGWDAKPAKGLATFAKMRSLWAMHAAMHVAPGERCFDVLRRFGYMLHGVGDFYAHCNWVEVFHQDLHVPMDEIPTWTSFQKAQRGAELNLFLLEQADYDVTTAISLYHTLDIKLQLGTDDPSFNWHDRYNKDSMHILNYSSDNQSLHADADGHNIADYFDRAKFLAGTETYQLGTELRSNVLNNPQLGQAYWNRLFNCLWEMAVSEGVSPELELAEYTKSIRRLRTYSNMFNKWE